MTYLEVSEIGRHLVIELSNYEKWILVWSDGQFGPYWQCVLLNAENITFVANLTIAKTEHPNDWEDATQKHLFNFSPASRDWVEDKSHLDMDPGHSER
jgi:hypothetical protein